MKYRWTDPAPPAVKAQRERRKAVWERATSMYEAIDRMRRQGEIWDELESAMSDLDCIEGKIPIRKPAVFKSARNTQS